MKGKQIYITPILALQPLAAHSIISTSGPSASFMENPGLGAPEVRGFDEEE